MTGVRNGAARSVRLRRAGVWLGMFALLLQTALPMSGMPLVQGVAGLSGDTSTICDFRAPQQDDPARRGGDGGSQHAPPCPVCQILQQFGTYLPPAVAAQAMPARTFVAGKTPSDPVFTPKRIITSCRVRAPPAAA